MKILVLGAGTVGRVIALDLSTSHDVTAADRDADTLASISAAGVKTIRIDVTNSEALSRTLVDFDLVVGAVPGFLGFRMVQTVIRSRKPIIDISFCSEDVLSLQDLAIENGVVAIVDAGVAPGLDNLILGHHDRSMDVDTFECYVGGLPRRRKWPFEYKAPFSPIDVIEEYTRPARYVEAGRQVIRPALTDPDLLWFEEVGTLEAFNTDGLRTLITTMPHVPNMKEKTLRYPGHIALIQALKDSGFFSEKEIVVNDNAVRPLDVTSQILLKEWELEPDEPEFTIMRVVVAGAEDGVRARYTYDLYDEFDPGSGFSSMARTTGFTCAAMVMYVAEHGVEEPGVYPLERIGQLPAAFGLTLKYLTERGVVLRGRRDQIDSED